MIMFRQIATSACVGALLVVALPAAAAAAAPHDLRTYFTFNRPVALPGVTLAAGTYQFRLVDPVGGRGVVQVLSEDGSESHAMLLSIPAHRFDAPDDPEVHFKETPAGAPLAVKVWWYPGTTIGHEFIYPDEQSAYPGKATGHEF
jgi:hypothetical protein